MMRRVLIAAVIAITCGLSPTRAADVAFTQFIASLLAEAGAARGVAAPFGRGGARRGGARDVRAEDARARAGLQAAGSDPAGAARNRGAVAGRVRAGAG